jgi:hypothetical protein
MKPYISEKTWSSITLLFNEVFFLTDVIMFIIIKNFYFYLQRGYALTRVYNQHVFNEKVTTLFIILSIFTLQSII